MPNGTTSPTRHPNRRALAALVMNSSAAFRIGDAALIDGEAVLVEVEAVDAPRATAGRGAALTGGGAARPERQDVQPRPAFDVSNVGQARDLAHDARVIAGAPRRRVVHRGREPQIGGVGAREIGGKRRLRSPRRRHRAHGQATQQADEEHQTEIAAPPAAQRRPEPVPRNPKHLPHRDTPPSASSPTSLSDSRRHGSLARPIAVWTPPRRRPSRPPRVTASCHHHTSPPQSR